MLVSSILPKVCSHSRSFPHPSLTDLCWDNAPSLDPSVIADPVQHECLLPAIQGMDILCQAKSGMGKTAVFVMSILHRLQPVEGETSVLVLTHTRELAFQIAKEFNRFSKYMPDVKTAVFYGGAHNFPQRSKLHSCSRRPSHA